MQHETVLCEFEFFAEAYLSNSVILGSDASMNKVIPMFRGNVLSSPSMES